MWFVFPQVEGLGRSAIARHYAVSGLQEARDYLAHPVLGPRLRQCCEAVLAIEDASAEQVFGSVDAMKLRSSMTLFARAAPDEPLFDEVLKGLFGGRADAATDGAAREVARLLTREVDQHMAGELRDDATAVCFDWRR